MPGSGAGGRLPSFGMRQRGRWIASGSTIGKCGFIRTAFRSAAFGEDRARSLGAGGPNYRILLKLAERGAALEGTEDPDLLRTEYELIMKTAGHAPATELAGPSEGAHAAQFQELLDLRDRFIARRIDATLLEGEVGILFLGALHHVVQQIACHDRGRVAARNARGR